MNTVNVNGYNLSVETQGNKIISFSVHGEDYNVVSKLSIYYKRLFANLTICKEKLIAFLAMDLTVILENIKEGV